MFRTEDPSTARLSVVPVFQDLTSRERRRIARHVDFLDVEPGQVLIAEGLTNHHLYLVVDGLLTVERGDEAVATVGPDSLVGEMTALGATRASATVRVAAPTTVAIISHRALGALALDRPMVADALRTIAAERAVTAA